MNIIQQANKYASDNYPPETRRDLYDAFLSGYAAANAWIPVSERLPELNKRVFVTCGKVVDSGYLDASGIFYDERERDFEHPIKYWMEIPALPTPPTD